MWGVKIDAGKAQAVPASLSEWTSREHKGPRALVAELSMGGGAAEPEEGAAYTLKGWTSGLGPRAMVARAAC